MHKNIIANGVPWYDQHNHTVNAHAGCVVKENDRYYLFGEYKTNDENKFIGFSCYSSSSLTDWRYEGVGTHSSKRWSIRAKSNW